MKEYKIDRYRLFYLSGPKDYVAKITSYNDITRVAMIFFIDDSMSLPENFLDNLPMKIYYPLSSFQNILTILENEKPLSIFVYDNGKTCEIGSQDFLT